MSGHDPEERFADKLDRLLFEGVMDPEDEDRDLLEFAQGLSESMPPVEADRSFQSSLRAQLIVAANERLPMAGGRQPETAESGLRKVLGWWRRRTFVVASVASILVIAAGVFAYQYSQPPSGARSPAGAPTAVAQGTPVAGTPEAAPEASVMAGEEGQGGTEEIAVAAEPEDQQTAAAEAVAQFGKLPPVQTMTEVPVYGLGGGGPEPAPLKIPAFPLPPKLIDEYVLDGALPEGLPAEAKVYLLRVVDDPRAEAMAIAARFGVTGEPEVAEIGPGPESPAPSDQQFMWFDGKVNLNCRPAEGAVFYSSMPDTGGGVPDILITTGEEAGQAAWDFLERKGLLPPSFVVELAEEVYTGDETGLEGTGSQLWRVKFRKDIDGLTVGGDSADIVLDRHGRVLNMSFVSRDIIGESVYPLAPVEQAWQSVVEGKALWIEMSPVMADPDGALRTARISGVSISYQGKLPGQRQDYLQPLYRFTGVASVGDGEEYPIAVYAPAVAGEFIGE